MRPEKTLLHSQFEAIVMGILIIQNLLAPSTKRIDEAKNYFTLIGHRTGGKKKVRVAETYLVPPAEKERARKEVAKEEV